MDIAKTVDDYFKLDRSDPIRQELIDYTKYLFDGIDMEFIENVTNLRNKLQKYNHPQFGEHPIVAATMLIITHAIDLNAGELNETLTDFKDKGEIQGDFKLTVKKLTPKQA